MCSVALKNWEIKLELNSSVTHKNPFFFVVLCKTASVDACLTCSLT